MARVKRMERVVALTKQLVDHPYQLFSFTYFCKKFEVAKSTLSEDVLAVRAGLGAYDLGRVETLAGAAGGVRFIPCHSEKANEEFLTELALQLAEPERILSGGMIYMTDLLFKPQLVMRLGEIIAQRLRHLEPEYIMTVETRGIPLAVFVARASNNGVSPQISITVPQKSFKTASVCITACPVPSCSACKAICACSPTIASTSSAS